MKKLSPKVMKSICKNLMINISDKEQKIILKMIEHSIKRIQKIKNFNLDEIEPLDFVMISIKNDFRDDVAKDFKDKQKILDNALEKVDKYIKV